MERHKPDSSYTAAEPLRLNGIISLVWKILSSTVKGQDEMLQADGRKSFAVLRKEIVVTIAGKLE